MIWDGPAAFDPVSVAVLVFVTLQRGVELVLARRHTQALMGKGAFEVAPEHYPLIVALHGAWLLGLWILAPTREADLPLLALYTVLQAGRIWVLATLGERWTTRIVILPGAPLVRTGPYRFVSHPNYVIVAAELFLLPLVFGLIAFALIFSVLNALVLWVRIRAENNALAELSRPQSAAP